MSIPPAAGLPNETWSEILECLYGEYLDGDLKSVAAASKRFLALSRPFLFQNITLKLCYTAALVKDLEPGVLEEKLRFFTSLEMARHVQSLTVACACRRYGRLALASDTEPSCNALGALLFQTLSRFKSLRNLSLVHLVLEADHLEKLQSLPSLRHLFAASRDWELKPLQGVVPRVPVISAELDIVVPSTKADNTDILRHWLDILDPRTLRELELSCNTQQKDVALLTRFSNIEVLTLRTDEGGFRGLLYPFALSLPTLSRSCKSCESSEATSLTTCYLIALCAHWMSYLGNWATICLTGTKRDVRRSWT
uniref:F-box domain-containing protein n=1 Tax=Mycena chlorophos TaxID=658473 RepID=A0ABQ0L579_MYCCL|nr:predicted protein [Mycena chlorophos]